MSGTSNKLYFGDNLEVLRNDISDESIDLIYLDPPFNSKATYNVLFKSPADEGSVAQIHAFEDTWHWGEQSEQEFDEILKQKNTSVSEMMRAFRQFLGENDMMAYLTMMSNRLLELQRVLRPTGSIYLHCDPNASHYLKVLMDNVFGPQNFRNEIIWKRTSGHSDATRFGSVHDTLLFYSNGNTPTWIQTYQPYEEWYVEAYYRFEDLDGRKWMSGDLSAAGLSGGGYEYEWKGITRVWRCPEETMRRLEEGGYIYYTRNGIPRRKRYLDESEGMPAQDVWADIQALRSWHGERLGYPTQKPIQLLERIINASSNEGDIVLDPFCGCGTAVHAAELLNRRWVGIDITHLAISLIEKRMRDAFPGITFDVHGTPVDAQGAADLAERDKYQFQWWACSLVNAQPFQGKKKGADSGIDGIIYFQDDKGPAKKIVVSVKAGKNVNVAMVRDLMAVVDRERASIGLFVTLTEPTGPMKKEAVKAGFYESDALGVSFPKIQILTVEGLLNRIQAPQYPDLSHGATTSKKAKIAVKASKQTTLF